MQVSKSRTALRRLPRPPLAAAILLACQPAIAQDVTLEEVLVTAQKRVENLQDVPISIQSLGAEALEELNLKDFKSYVNMLPSVAMTPSLGAGSGVCIGYRFEKLKTMRRSFGMTCKVLPGFLANSPCTAETE